LTTRTIFTPTLTERISVYESARRRGIDFLLANIGPDGTVRDAGRSRVSYYRVPWALVLAGETGAASRVLGWIERTRLGADGAFHGGVAWDPVANRTANTYAETCLAYGAVLLRHFDVARRTMAFASRFQDPETGGIFMSRERTGPDGPQLLFLTCQFGMSAVIAGDLAAALRVGEWLERLWAAQPALPDRLHTVWTRAGGLAVAVPPGDDERHYVNDSRAVRQFHYNGGIAAACLTHLFLATGDERWLNLARGYQRFSMETTEGQFETRQVCKSAWGAGLLSLATDDPDYTPWLRRMGDWFAALQDEDGRWSNTPYLDPNPPLAHQIEATAEFTVHLDTLIAALAAVAARDVAASATTREPQR
jgi:hypothetical protein